MSASASKSVIHYTIVIDVEYAELHVSTVSRADEALKPIAYTALGEKPVGIKIDEVSEYGKSLPGD